MYLRNVKIFTKLFKNHNNPPPLLKKEKKIANFQNHNQLDGVVVREVHVPTTCTLVLLIFRCNFIT